MKQQKQQQEEEEEQEIYSSSPPYSPTTSSSSDEWKLDFTRGTSPDLKYLFIITLSIPFKNQASRRRSVPRQLEVTLAFDNKDKFENLYEKNFIEIKQLLEDELIPVDCSITQDEKIEILKMHQNGNKRYEDIIPSCVYRLYNLREIRENRKKEKEIKIQLSTPKLDTILQNQLFEEMF